MILPLDHVLKCDQEMIEGDDVDVSEWWMMNDDNNMTCVE